MRDPSARCVKGKQLGVRRWDSLIFRNKLDHHRGTINVRFGSHKVAPDISLVPLAEHADFITVGLHTWSVSMTDKSLSGVEWRTWGVCSNHKSRRSNLEWRLGSNESRFQTS